MRSPLEEKWSRLFAAKRYHTKDGVIKLDVIEQQELLDDFKTIPLTGESQRKPSALGE